MRVSSWRKGMALGMGLAIPALAAPAMAITIPLVSVGEPGNAANTYNDSNNDPRSHGAVNYSYQIGKYEVTATEYTAFLNAIAVTDTKSVYAANMLANSGITQSGLSGSFSYSVDPAYANRPVTNISFWSAIRFANWMHNGQPTGAQDNSSTEDGSYTITAQGITDKSIVRNAGATWVVTSEEEWYKAAYYNAGTQTYFNYPTSNDSGPGPDTTDASGNNANLRKLLDGTLVDPTYKTTEVGEFQNSESPYGTFDQAGNIYEWTERVGDPTFHGLAGGHYGNYYGAASATYPYYDTSNYNNGGSLSYPGDNIGFRVALVPEPASVALVGLFGGLLTLGRSWRRKTAV